MGGGPSAEAPRGYVSSLSYSVDGRTLAAGRTFGRIELWDPQSNELRGSLPSVMGKYIGLSRDGSRIVVGDERHSGMYETASGAALVEDAGIRTVAVNATGSHAVSESTDGRLIVWNLTAGKIDANMKLDRDDITSAAVSPDGGECAFGTQSGDIVVLDVSAAAPAVSREMPVGSSVTALAYDASGDRLASTTSDGQLLVWNGDQLDEEASNSELATGGASRILWLSSNRLLLSIGTRLMLVESGAQLQLWQAGLESLNAVAAGDTVIAVGCEDESEIILYDVGTQKQRASLDVTGG